LHAPGFDGSDAIVAVAVVTFAVIPGLALLLLAAFIAAAAACVTDAGGDSICRTQNNSQATKCQI
jgi:hypothetical protein